jgi:hypothetical protein
MARRSSGVVPPHTPSVTPLPSAQARAMDLHRADVADPFRLFHLMQRSHSRTGEE